MWPGQSLLFVYGVIEVISAGSVAYHMPLHEDAPVRDIPLIPAVIGLRIDDREDLDYVNFLVVYAGCESEGVHLTVAKNHASPAECEIISLTPTMNSHAGLSEVDASFDWSSADPSIAEARGFKDPHDNIVGIMGKQDVFDTMSGQEPTTSIMACVTNTCPTPPRSCPASICASFNITSIVNLEGEWRFDTPALEAPVFPCFLQDGRELRDDELRLRGTITGKTLVINAGDYFYTGTITPDRTHIQGEYWDAMNNVPLADWQAEKLSP